jgi:hypothetical protein
MISCIGIVFHELWMDESHHFLLGRDSTSFLDVFNKTRYDGHPILWNYLIHLLTKFTINPFYMQILHICVSSFTVYIFLKKAPFQLWFKIGFTFSYFMLYEYTVISRNYNLGVLFLFLSCIFYQKRKEKFTIFCFFLGLCCNTHSIFTIVASTLLFSVFLEQIAHHKTKVFRKYWKGYLIFIIAISLAYYQIIPRSDSTYFKNINYNTSNAILKSSLSLFKALLPIVDFTTIHFWNNFYLIQHFKTFSLIFGILVWILPLLFFNKNKYVLLFVYATIITFILFEIITYRYGIRYNGLLFITVICGFWLMKNNANKPLLKVNFIKINKIILIFLMFVQTTSGVLAYSLDLKYTFNNGEKVANFIKDKKIDTNTIITACESASINAYLSENLYNLVYQKPQGFYIWNYDITSFYKKTPLEMVSLAFKCKPNYNKLYLIFYKPINLEKNIKSNFSISLVKKFDNAVKQDYYLYLIQKNE